MDATLQIHAPHQCIFKKAEPHEGGTGFAFRVVQILSGSWYSPCDTCFGGSAHRSYLDYGRTDFCVAREVVGSCGRIYVPIAVRLFPQGPSLGVARRVRAYFAASVVPPNTIKENY